MILSSFKRIDLFGAAIPQFNLQGKDEVRTATGGFFSLLVIITSLMFAILKLEHLLSRKSPNIVKLRQEGILDVESDEGRYDLT